MPRPALLALALALAVLAGTSVAPVAVADDGAPPPAAPWVRYLRSTDVAARLALLAAPEGVPREGWSVQRYGTSAGGRPLLALRVGDPALPLVLVHGGLGARDAAATVAVLHLAQRLAAGEDPEAPRVAWLLVPAPNPDALDAFLDGGPRAGGGAADRDRDGRVGEDGPSDLDGDGEVLTMRRADPRGAFAPEPGIAKDGKRTGDPRLILDRGVDARRPVSYEVLEEGLDDDGDGAVNEDPPGLDLTRQMLGHTEAKGPWPVDGPFPGYAPETRALMDLSFEAPTLLAWYGFAGEGPRILRAGENGKVADGDEPLHARVAEALKARVGVDVRVALESRGPVENGGSDLDWAALQLGVPAFRVPVWRIAKEEGSARDRADPDELDWLLWNDRVLGGIGFVPWRPFDHPTLGAVEIGGWRRFTRREPPEDLLPAAVAAVSGAPLVHARFRPVLAADVAVERVGAGLVRVTLRARNAGEAPTETASAERRRRAHGVRARFVPADGWAVVAGPPVLDLGTVPAGGVSGPAVWLVEGRGEGSPGSATLVHRVAGRVAAEAPAP